MRKVATFFLAIIIAIGSVASAANADLPKIKILAIGDSINTGYGSKDNCGARTEVTRLLYNVGYEAVWQGEPVGTGPNSCPYAHRFGPDGQAPNDPNAGTVQSMRDNILTWLAAGNPDVVMITVGTRNAAGQGAGLANYQAVVTDLISKILNYNSTTKVLIALIPYSITSWAPNEVTVNIATILGVLSFNNPRVAWVDLQQYPPIKLYDSLHPSDYVQIGNLFYNGLAAMYNLPIAEPAEAWHSVSACRPGIERPVLALGCYGP